jgi:hypothetical protein
MRIIPPSKPTFLESALVAPLVTPIIAFPMLGIFPDVLTDDGYYLAALLFIFFISLFVGYLGMFIVCLPIAVLLSLFNRLNALTLCTCTGLIGALLWAWFRADPMQNVMNSLAVGFTCSVGVAVTFSYASGITIRSSRTQPAARDGSA